MRFSRRLVTVRDLKWCSDILEDGFENRLDLRSRLPELWAGLLSSSALTMIVVQDDAAQRRVAFGAGVIVPDEFVTLARQAHRPHVGVALIEKEARQPGVHVLRPDQIRKVNHPGHGVNLLILHYSEAVDQYGRDELRLVRDKSLQALVELQAGYAMKEVLFEFYGEDDLPYCHVMGMNLRDTYEQYYLPGSIPVPPREKRPFLVGLARDEMEAKWGSPVASLFTYARPYFFFTPAQQNVLIRALLGESDAEICDDLCIMNSTIREHWKAIYERVLDVQQNWRRDLKVLKVDGHLPGEADYPLK